jgi:hypothetical protein
MYFWEVVELWTGTWLLSDPNINMVVGLSYSLTTLVRVGVK